MKNNKVETETVVETPKAAETATEVKIVKTPVAERMYKLKAEPSIPPKGKQRQIVLQILRDAKGEPMVLSAVAKKAQELGLAAVGGIEPSCRYHLHHLNLNGFVEIMNPTATKEIVAA